MLETIDSQRKLNKKEYSQRYAKLCGEFRTLQRRCYEKRIPVIILFEGWDASGKGETINRVVNRLDPRGVQIHTTFRPTDLEKMFPFLHGFWLRLPEDGDIVIFDRSWYRRVLSARARGIVSKGECFRTYKEITQFERQLVDHGTIIAKFWLHLSKKKQARRLGKIADDKYRRWRIGHVKGDRQQQYKGYAAGFEELFEQTNTHSAPWTIVPAANKRYCVIKVLETICNSLASLTSASTSRKPAEMQPERSYGLSEERPVILKNVNPAREMSKGSYRLALKEQQLRIRENEFRIFRHRIPVVVVYEGWDAAGKGGNIKRVTEYLDPRGFSVIPIAAPRGEEKTRHYLLALLETLSQSGPPGNF